MQIEKTKLDGCLIIHDTVFGDNRGYFFESFNKKTFLEKTGIDVNFIQDNQSKSSRGVLRGLHFQHGEYAQAKLVRVLEGKVLDIAVDLRRNSPTFQQHVAIELSEDSHTQFFVPRGFAHGFVVLSETAEFLYKTTDYYHPEHERSVLWSDPAIGIDWPFDFEPKLAAKDAQAAVFRDAETFA
jgi:dTDP-4-dehydrorhamnose 3,5-epimerase